MDKTAQEAVIASIRAEAAIRIDCLSAEEAQKFRSDLAAQPDPDPSRVDSVLFLGPPSPQVWMGFGATEHLGDSDEEAAMASTSCDGLIETIAKAVGVETPSAREAAIQSGSPWLAVVGILALTGTLVAAIRWQILRKQRTDWVEAPRDSRDVDAPQVVQQAKNGETASEASMGVVEGGSRKGTK